VPPLLEPKLLFDGEQRAFRKVLVMHRDNREFPVQFNVMVRTDAGLESGSQFSQLSSARELSLLLLPGLMLAGLAAKELITGKVAACTATVTVAFTEPAALVAVGV
jgi:hypothetical protein